MTDKLPWCPNCKAYAPPQNGRCGDCETLITWKGGNQ